MPTIVVIDSGPVVAYQQGCFRLHGESRHGGITAWGKATGGKDKDIEQARGHKHILLGPWGNGLRGIVAASQPSNAPW